MLVEALYNQGRIELAKLRPFFRVLLPLQVKIPVDLLAMVEQLKVEGWYALPTPPAISGE